MKRLLFVLAAASSVVLPACGSRDGDPPSANGDAAGNAAAARIRDVTDPTRADHPASGATVTVSRASVLTVDNFDETGTGKSRGTIFMQDVASTEPWSGVSLFSPTFLPTDYKPAAGDVVSLVGQYQENKNIGTAYFPAGQVLPQIAKPSGAFLYEWQTPTARVIDVKDLESYATGRRWLSMLVTVQDVTTGALSDDGSGRVTTTIDAGFTGQNAPTMTNELFDLKAWNAQKNVIAPGAKIKSVTGVVTYFFSLHIAPRSADDIVVQ